MTATELDAFFDRKHREIVDRLIGEDVHWPVPDPVTTRVVSPIRDGSPDGFRFTPPAVPNPSAFLPWLGWYNEQMHINDNKIVVYVEDDKLDAEVPPPVK